MQGVNQLTQGNISKQLFKLSLPLMATSFVQMAYSLTDMAWVGRIGSEAAAAVGAVGILVWMTSSFSLLNKVGAVVSVGHSIGANNKESARDYASHNTMLSLCISAFLAVVLFVFAEPVVKIYNLEEHIAVNATAYLRIVATALPFYFVSTAFTGIYNGAGRSKEPFYISAIGLVLNILLDPLFIFVFDFGVKGAAYATWISQAVVCLLFIYRLRCQDHLLDNFPFVIKLRWKQSWHVIKIGLPVAIFNTLFAIVNMSMGRIATDYGGHIGLMSLTTGGQIEAISWNTAQGFSTALSTFVAQNYAIKAYPRIEKAWRIGFAMSALFGSVASLLFIFFGRELFSIFVPETAAFIAGGLYLKISGFSQLFMMLEITMQGLFFGLGRTMTPAIVSIVGNYARIPLALFLAQKGFGIEGVWWAISITSIAKGIILCVWFWVLKHRLFRQH